MQTSQTQPSFHSQSTPTRSVGFISLVSSLFAFVLFAVTPLAAPAQTHYTSKHIYSETADPRADIAAALKQAAAEKKNVILDFGGDWCGDCQVLDIYFHQAPNSDLIASKYVLVHVWIGRMDHNVDVAEKYGVPLGKGVPALAVLSPSGKVLYSQKTGEFENMRNMDTSSVTSFLEKWKHS